MTFKFIKYTLLAVGIGNSTACTEQVDRDACEKLQSQRLIIDSHAEDQTSRQQELYKLTACGLDSIDCEIAGYILSTLLLKRVNTGQDTEITFGELLAEVKQAKNLPYYQEARLARVRPQLKL